MNSPRETDPLDRPLFGSPRSSDRVINLVVGVLTGLMVCVTVISAFVFPEWPPDGVNVFFVFVIGLVLGSHLTLIYWYRQGDLEPRFRSMIYYNTVTLFMLCIVGNLYIHKVDKRSNS